MSSSAGSQPEPHSNAAVTIDHLPNEILMQIYHCLANLQDPVLLPIEIDNNLPAQDLQYDVRQYSDLILTKNYTALMLRLVSRRFNYLFKQFIIENIVIVQSKLFLLQPRGEAPMEMQSSRQFMEAENLAKSMERLRNLLNLNPELGQRCKSLCLAYKQVKVPVRVPSRPDTDEGWIPPEHLIQDLDIYNFGSLYEGHEGWQLEEKIVPNPSWLNNSIYSCLSNVTDVQIHSNHYGNILPDITPALSSFSNLTTLRVTGKVDYASLIKQLIEILTPSSALQTLDLSCAPAKWWSHAFAEIALRLMDVEGTAPFTRLLTGPHTDPDILKAMVAWPRRLERLALQTSPEQMTISQREQGSVQHILDTQKNSLTHLRFEGEYEPGLLGFDLRGFPCLEHLALSSATISDRSWLERNDNSLADPREHILAPRLRSLLLVMPPNQSEDGESFNFESSNLQAQEIMNTVSEELLEGQEARKERSLKRIWVQTLTKPLESLPAHAQETFAAHLRNLAWVDDMWGEPDGPLLQHVPLPKGGMGIDAPRRGPFPPLDEVWSWDDDTGPGELLLNARRQRAALRRVRSALTHFES
ncbi:hypothetical protein ACHAPO_007057 [Fusarium lateritium]